MQPGMNHSVLFPKTSKRHDPYSKQSPSLYLPIINCSTCALLAHGYSTGSHTGIGRSGNKSIWSINQTNQKIMAKVTDVFLNGTIDN